MSIRDNVEYINNSKRLAAERNGRTGEEILLIAVTKLHSPDEINEAIDAGITDIGENKVQEILDKYERVKPVKWHLIGHLQRNKVKYIIDKVDLIHSVDSFRLAQEIEKQASQHNRIIDVLIQVNPAGEESKFGIDPTDIDELIDQVRNNCPHVRIRGIMSIAPFFDDAEDCRPVFKQVKDIYDKYKDIHDDRIDFKYLSMGMSHDFEVAIEEGSNCIRVGTAIFGNRDYRSEEM